MTLRLFFVLLTSISINTVAFADAIFERKRARCSVPIVFESEVGLADGHGDLHFDLSMTEGLMFTVNNDSENDVVGTANVDFVKRVLIRHPSYPVQGWAYNTFGNLGIQVFTPAFSRRSERATQYFESGSTIPQDLINTSMSYLKTGPVEIELQLQCDSSNLGGGNSGDTWVHLRTVFLDVMLRFYE